MCRSSSPHTRRYLQYIAPRLPKCLAHTNATACVLDTDNVCQLALSFLGLMGKPCTTPEWQDSVKRDLGPSTYGSAFYCPGSIGAEVVRCRRVLEAMLYRCVWRQTRYPSQTGTRTTC